MPWPRYVLVLGLEWLRVPGSTATSLHASLESQRFGLFGRAHQLELPAGGDKRRGATQLMSVHLSWAMVALPALRLRAEGGVSLAGTSGSRFSGGASMGLSGELHVLGLLALEARAQLTPLPYRQLDAAAGVAVYLGPITLRGGQRLLLLDKADLMAGFDTHNAPAGPYFGIGLSL